ncbi:MAG: 30S ribosomal protein S3ae, partial [Candidatus Thermoplasmatota archaeon]|nr:30S ribosomal protein S3ae [Candidatus Thermoplasmatota archaeon]
MAKARARSAARKVKDKWRAKTWYQIHAPALFDEIIIAESLAEKPELLIDRVTEVSMQNITNDFRKSHIKLFFKVNRVNDSDAYTVYTGHTLTSDYIRRMIRRRKSRIDGIYDVETRDGAKLRVKPFAITDKRIQTSQKKLIRQIMKNTVVNEGKSKTLNEFLRDMIDGKIGSEIYKGCKIYYPVKRVEVYKTEISRQPTIIIEDTKPKKEEPPTEDKPTTKKPKPEKETLEEAPTEKPTEIKETKPPVEKKEKKVTKKKTTKTTTKKTTKK